MSAQILRRGPSRDAQIARALGWLSIGLGVAALMAPRPLGRSIGLGDRAGLLRFAGLRELVSGAGLLTQQNKVPWLWSRVAGDAMDLAVLGTALRSGNSGRRKALGATAAVATIAAADVGASLRHMASSRARASGPAEAYLERSIVVNKSPQECYAFWRDVGNLPRFTPMLRSVVALDDRRSHWVLAGPAGRTLEWDSEITMDKPGERLAWHSLEGSRLTHAGAVWFEPAIGGRGTLVRVVMHYQPRAGWAGAGLARLIGRDPSSEVREDLRRFKQLIETGEIPTTRGQSSGRRSFVGRRIAHEVREALERRPP